MNNLQRDKEIRALKKSVSSLIENFKQEQKMREQQYQAQIKTNLKWVNTKA